MRVECNRFERWASLYRDYRLPGRARTAVERHLGYCSTCSARFEAYGKVLDSVLSPPLTSSLIPADVTHEIPPMKKNGGNLSNRRKWKQRGLGILVWLLGVVLLTALLTTAFVLGYRAGVHSLPPPPEAVNPEAVNTGENSSL